MSPLDVVELCSSLRYLQPLARLRTCAIECVGSGYWLPKAQVHLPQPLSSPPLTRSLLLG